MIEPSGGRAGVHGLKWLNAGYNLEQIESLRQRLMYQKDIGRVERAMRQFGITVKREYEFIASQVNRYISDPKLKITVLQAAAIDPTRLISGTKETQAARHMFVGGVPPEARRPSPSFPPKHVPRNEGLGGTEGGRRGVGREGQILPEQRVITGDTRFNPH